MKEIKLLLLLLGCILKFGIALLNSQEAPDFLIANEQQMAQQELTIVNNSLWPKKPISYRITWVNWQILWPILTQYPCVPS